MYYFKDKIILMVEYTRINNKINNLNIFKNEKYIKNEEFVISEVKELIKSVDRDIVNLYNEYKYCSEITNINKGEDTVSFSLSIINEDCIKNDFFISFLVYISLYKILKYKEYYGMDLVDMENKYDNLLSNFQITVNRGNFRFKYETAIGNYFMIDNKENNSLSSITFESIEENNKCLNTYYVNNVSYDFYNNFIKKFKMIEPK